MANIVETANYDTGVYLLDVGDAVLGGANGPANKPLTNLANRTAWLKAQVALLAPIDSPIFTGDPKSVTPTSGDNDTSIATTAFVVNAKNGATTVNVAGNANVTLTAAQAGVGILLLTGALTGAITVFVPPGTGQYIIANNTTGSYTLKVGVSGASGTTAIIPQSNSVVAYSDGSNVVLAGAASTSAFTRYWFTATPGQTTFNAIYTVGNVLATVNGVVQAPGDVTATDSATVVLSGYNGGAGCIGGEEVEVIAFSSFTVANAMTPAGGTFSGPVMLAGGDTGVTPAQFNSSTKLATTAFVQRALGNYTNGGSITGATTLTAAQAGSAFSLNNTTAYTVTLPAISSVTPGSSFTFYATNSAGVTIAVASGDGMLTGGGTNQTSIVLNYGDSAVLVLAGGYWQLIGGTLNAKYSSGFAASLGGSGSAGYQKNPSGMIFQWGTTGSVPQGGSNVATFPIAFPNACIGVTATGSQTASVSNGWNLAVGALLKTSFTAYNNGANGTLAGYYVAWGY
jgi:hypothetical protein